LVVTDVSSKGLIPQLTDVLYALTDSHERLLFKLQALRRVHDSAGSMVVDQTPSSVFFRGTVDQTDGAHHEVLLNGLGRTNGSDPPSLMELESRPALADELASADKIARDEPATQRDPESVSPTDTQSQVVGTQRESESTPPPDPSITGVLPPATHAAPTNGASADRDYNFFDELDARLTHIQDLDFGSGEQGST
jgi:hypothetical protein